MERVNHCGRCGQPRETLALFCGCGKLYDLAELRQVKFATDETRGRALDEMYATVEAGRVETQQETESRLERDVYEHLRSAV